MSKRIGVLTSGGDCPGLNAVLRGVVRAATNLDWKVFGRTDRLVVKQYEEQTSVAAVAVIDDSASMGFSWDGRPSKLEYAKTLAAAENRQPTGALTP